MAEDPSAELAAEQRHIDRAYEVLDRLREGARAAAPGAIGDDEGAGGTFQSRFERELATADARRRVGELRWGDPPLCFGRIDRTDGQRFHIGRIGVFDERHDPLVVDWRAPVAEGFYRATRADPMGLRRRRSFHCRGRRLLAIDDVAFDADSMHDGSVVGEAALLASLESPRTGRMGDAVATVQAEQDEVIRAPMAGITIVQGAAGTGKTVVALHRAAYLLYTFREVLDRQGVLILGPNGRFLDYVRDVLPSLGEHDANLATVAELFPGVAAVPEADVTTATVKADLRMAAVLRRAVRTRQRHVREVARIPVGRFVLKLECDVVNAVVDEVRGLAGSHNARRRFVEQDLVDVLYAELNRRNVAPADRQRDPGRRGMAQALGRTPEFEVLLERIWPLLSPQELLHDLFGSEALLRAAARRDLDEHERAALHRPRSRRVDDVEWTEADVPLLHEAHALLGPLPVAPPSSTEPTEDEQFTVDRVIEGVRASMELPLDEVMEADLRRSVLDEVRADLGAPEDVEPPDVVPVWGSVLVDEAQDLSPMAWRMVGRSCPNQAMTIVGDLAQGTRPWSPASWDDVVGWIGPRHPARRHELHINYRTPREIMDWASPFSVAPESAVAVRSTGIPPRAVATSHQQLAATVVAELVAMRDRTRDGRFALIGAAGRQLDDCGPGAGDAELGDIEVHTPESVKGLEYDGVVLVEPAEIVAGPGGEAALYIALTRATTHLVVVHAAALPPTLAAAASASES